MHNKHYRSAVYIYTYSFLPYHLDGKYNISNNSYKFSEIGDMLFLSAVHVNYQCRYASSAVLRLWKCFKNRTLIKTKMKTTIKIELISIVDLKRINIKRYAHYIPFKSQGLCRRRRYLKSGL